MTTITKQGGVVATTNRGPTIIHKKPIKDIEIKQINQDNLLKYMTYAQLTKLKGLTYSNGNLIFNIDNNIDYDLLYYIIQLIIDYGFDQAYEYLVSQKWEDSDEIFFNTIYFDKYIKNFSKTVESYHDKPEVSGGIACIYCGSTETIMQVKQTSSGDEGQTVHVTCIKQGHQFRMR